MKKILTSLMTVMFVLLVISPAAFASDMKLYRNDNDHYSILVPSDWEYQDVNKIDNIKSEDTILVATSKSGEMISIQKYKEYLFPPVEDWTDINHDIFIQGIKRKFKANGSTSTESGDTYINNHKLLLVKACYSTQEKLLYIAVHDNLLYYITYVYPINTREESLPKITKSINSLKFDEITPNWYWISSSDHVDMYIDTNNISSNKNTTTNTVYKTVTIKYLSPEYSNYFTSIKSVLELKSENAVDYFRVGAMAAYDANDKFIQDLTNLKKNDHSLDKEWKNVAEDESMSKLANLLFEKNQQKAN